MSEPPQRNARSTGAPHPCRRPPRGAASAGLRARARCGDASVAGESAPSSLAHGGQSRAGIAALGVGSIRRCDSLDSQHASRGADRQRRSCDRRRARPIRRLARLDIAARRAGPRCRPAPSLRTGSRPAPWRCRSTMSRCVSPTAPRSCSSRARDCRLVARQGLCRHGHPTRQLGRMLVVTDAGIRLGRRHAVRGSLSGQAHIACACAKVKSCCSTAHRASTRPSPDEQISIDATGLSSASPRFARR